MDDETRQVLARAKGFVADGWIQGGLCKADGVCLMGALYKADSLFPYRAHTALCEAAGLTPCVNPTPLPAWNDEPGRTQDEVVALFDKVLADNPAPVLVEAVA